MYGLNTYLRGMFNRGILDEITFDYLMKGNQNYYGPGYMYILPKIHRLNQSDILKIEDNGFNIDKIIPPGKTNNISDWHSYRMYRTLC